MRYRLAAMTALLGIVLVGSLQAAETTKLDALLGRGVVDPTLSLVEVQRYCEARVPPMPSVQSAEAWMAEATRLRNAVLEKIVFRGEAIRWREAATRVEWLDSIDAGPGYRIRKLRFEALPGLWLPAVLYEPLKLEGKVPVILNVNGHVGVGKQYPPKQIRCINQAKRGMLALNVEWLGMGQLSGGGFLHPRMSQLDLCGTSGLAPFYLSLKRSLDVLLGLEHADPKHVAVTGLSGSGWQTILISALDARVTLCNPVAGYSSLRTRTQHPKDLGDSEQAPCDLATLVDYTHLTAMLAPRPALLTYNAKDECCFESGYALQPLVDAAAPAYRAFGKEDHLCTHVNHEPGTHNYERENREAFYKMLGDFFYAREEFDCREIPSEDELKTSEQLAVAMPEKNEDFHTLALGLCKDLPRDASLPSDKVTFHEWQHAGRQRLRKIVRYTPYTAHAIERSNEPIASLHARSWWLQMNGAWTTPVVEIAPAEPTRTVILLADGGRKESASDAEKLLSEGCRVLAIEPLNFGERRIPCSILIDAVGERPLGIEAAEVAGAARWSLGAHKNGPVTVVARGPRSTVVALVAVALEPDVFASVELHGSLGSLREIIERNWAVIQAPELFCFGLLEAFDIKHLAALAATAPLTFREPSDRVKAELSDLAQWYRLFGEALEPVR